MNSIDLKKHYDKAIAYSERYQFLVDHGEWEMAAVAKRTRDIQFAKYTIAAKMEKQTADPHCAMSDWEALRIIRRECSQENFEWWLAQYSPPLLRIYVVAKKIKSIVNDKK